MEYGSAYEVSTLARDANRASHGRQRLRNGGTNGHVVLEAFNPTHVRTNDAKRTNDTPTDRTAVNGKQANGSLTKVAILHSNRRNSKRLFVISSQDQTGLKRIDGGLMKHLDGLGPVASSPKYLPTSHTPLQLGDPAWLIEPVFWPKVRLNCGIELSTELGENAVPATDRRPRIG